jgi:hypothetical protein
VDACAAEEGSGALGGGSGLGSAEVEGDFLGACCATADAVDDDGVDGFGWGKEDGAEGNAADAAVEAGETRVNASAAPELSSTRISSLFAIPPRAPAAAPLSK